MINLLFKNFNLLPTWVKRLLISITLIPIFMGLGIKSTDFEDILTATVIFCCVYWGVVLIICWIYAGTKVK